jgi:hypothetical protein
MESLNANNSSYNHKNAGTTSNVKPIICVSSAKEGKTQVGWATIVKQRAQRWTRTNNTPSDGSLIMFLIPMKWLWNPHVGKPKKNTMRMDVCIIVKQIENFDPKNWMKIVTCKKWQTMIPNWKHYKHPPIAPPNLGANLTSLECRKPFKIILKTSNLGNEFALYSSNFKIEIKNFPLEGSKTPHLNVCTLVFCGTCPSIICTHNNSDVPHTWANKNFM